MSTNKKLYVQYGCGLSAPESWLNFDVSPSLRLQKIPLVGSILKKTSKVVFPSNVVYGDIIKGLPIQDNSCDGLYCSHTLEHLALNDFRKALINSFKVLKKGGIFRCVVPDLEFAARSYIKDLDSGEATASHTFMKNTLLGLAERPRSAQQLIRSFWGNSHHLWMWDAHSLAHELREAGFINIRSCSFNDCEDEAFSQVEESGRFINAVAIECRK